MYGGVDPADLVVSLLTQRAAVMPSVVRGLCLSLTLLAMTGKVVMMYWERTGIVSRSLCSSQ